MDNADTFWIIKSHTEDAKLNNWRAIKRLRIVHDLKVEYRDQITRICLTISTKRSGKIALAGAMLHALHACAHAYTCAHTPIRTHDDKILPVSPGIAVINDVQF